MIVMGVLAASIARGESEMIDSPRKTIQERLDRLTGKWWLYLLLLLLFFTPAYASKGYDPRDSMALTEQVLLNPLIFALPVLMPIAKVIPAVLIVAVVVLGNRVRRAFNGYVALLYMALAVFQAMAFTDQYGFVVLFGNLVTVLVVALLWAWEVFAEENEFEPRTWPLWKWWVAPLALFALLGPVNPSTMSPDFSPLRLLTSESGLTYCMMTPVILAVLTLYYPTVNRAVLRVSSFVGIIYGAVNMLTWFVLKPSGWWMGVLHLPLVAISIYAFVLAHRRVQDKPAGERVPGSPRSAAQEADRPVDGG
jgi:hypothetical protein